MVIFHVKMSWMLSDAVGHFGLGYFPPSYKPSSYGGIPMCFMVESPRQPHGCQASINLAGRKLPGLLPAQQNAPAVFLAWIEMEICGRIWMYQFVRKHVYGCVYIYMHI